MSNSSLAFPSLLAVEKENSTRFNNPGNIPAFLCYYTRDLGLTVVFSFVCTACIFGLVGNGTVIWFLGFRLKRNPFTTYILNLAVADFVVLIAVIGTHVAECNFTDLPRFRLSQIVARSFFQFGYSISQFLLTAISIDRCVSVLFPIWYRCHRSRNLSTIVCALIWIVYFLVLGICTVLMLLGTVSSFRPIFYVYLVNAVVCLPLITLSTLILFVRFRFQSQLRKRGKVLVTILLALFCFLILAFPFNIICVVNIVKFQSNYDPMELYRLVKYGLLCASLNSFVNPLIYFLVGRGKKGLCRENLRLIFQRVFKEEDLSGGKLESSGGKLESTEEIQI